MRQQPTRAPLPPITDLCPVHGVVLSVYGESVDQRMRDGVLMWTANRQDHCNYVVVVSLPEGNMIQLDEVTAANPVVPANQPVICHQPDRPFSGWRVNGTLFLDLREAWDVEDCT